MLLWLNKFLKNLSKSHDLKELLKNFFRGLFYVLDEYTIITGVIFLFLSGYLIIKVLPKAYNANLEKRGLYSYWNNLGIAFILTFLSSSILFIQIYRIFKMLFFP